MAWSARNPDLLATASGDSSVVVFNPNGDIVRKFLLPSACFSCSFCTAGARPTDASAAAAAVAAGHRTVIQTRSQRPLPPESGPRLLAVASMDSCVYLFDIDAAPHVAPRMLRKHTAKVGARLCELPL